VASRLARRCSSVSCHLVVGPTAHTLVTAHPDDELLAARQPDSPPEAQGRAVRPGKAPLRRGNELRMTPPTIRSDFHRNARRYGAYVMCVNLGRYPTRRQHPERLRRAAANLAAWLFRLQDLNITDMTQAHASSTLIWPLDRAFLTRADLPDLYPARAAPSRFSGRPYRRVGARSPPSSLSQTVTWRWRPSMIT
jgi:hypothetical protein